MSNGRWMTFQTRNQIQAEWNKEEWRWSGIESQRKQRLVTKLVIINSVLHFKKKKTKSRLQCQFMWIIHTRREREKLKHIQFIIFVSFSNDWFFFSNTHARIYAVFISSVYVMKLSVGIRLKSRFCEDYGHKY